MAVPRTLKETYVNCSLYFSCMMHTIESNVFFDSLTWMLLGAYKFPISIVHFLGEVYEKVD
jgi:hypothetical protein